MTPFEALRKAVDEVLAEPVPEGKDGDPRRALIAAVVQVHWELRRLGKP